VFRLIHNTFLGYCGFKLVLLRIEVNGCFFECLKGAWAVERVRNGSSETCFIPFGQITRSLSQARAVGGFLADFGSGQSPRAHKDESTNGC